MGERPVGERPAPVAGEGPEGERSGGGARIGLHVGQLLQRVPGGIGRYVAELTRALALGGEAVTTFAAGPAPEGLPERDRVDHVDLGRPAGRLRYELWHRIRRPRLHLDVDVVHAPSLAIPPTDRPLVVTVHDLAFVRLPHYFTVHGIRFHERGLALARRHADAVVVPTSFVAAELVSQGFDEERIHVAPHGIDEPPERPADEVAAARTRLGVTSPYLLFVGTLEPRKGIAPLLAAFAELRARRPRDELSLVLAGARGWGKLPRLDEPGVVRVGAVSDDDLDALYRGTTALVYPSHYEGFGLPVLEAMVRGCPVVVSDAAALVEVAGDAAAVVPLDDPAALAASVAELVDDPARLDALARAGRERAGTFHWGASAAAHLAAYRAAAASRPGG